MAVCAGSSALLGLFFVLRVTQNFACGFLIALTTQRLDSWTCTLEISSFHPIPRPPLGLVAQCACQSVVMVFAKRALCACLDAPKLWGGACHMPTSDTVKYLVLRPESDGGWAAQQAAGAANGWVALHQWLPVLRSQYLSAAAKLPVLRSRITPCMTYGRE